MKCPFVIKICTKCNRLLVAWKGNFKKNKGGKWGLYPSCKECDKLYREKHKDKAREYGKVYREENKEKLKNDKKEWYEENRKRILEIRKEYRVENIEKISKYQKEYKEEHKKELKEKNKQYRENNPHILLNNDNKRRQLEENQGRGITKEQWYEMMCFFDWECAYSGEYLGGSGRDKRSVDHIIPLINMGENEPWNCVPMYINYNNSKRESDMLEWYIQQPYYSEERLIKIYAWCKYAFDKWKPRRKGNKKVKK